MDNKFRSRRFWITVWSCVMVTYIVISSVVTRFDPGWMPGAIAILAGIPTAYVAIGSAKKKKEE